MPDWCKEVEVPQNQIRFYERLIDRALINHHVYHKVTRRTCVALLYDMYMQRNG
jgi:hypothetical protein